MNRTSQNHQAQYGAQAEMRAVPGFDHETGRLTGVTLRRQPSREGASIGVLTERPDLDAAVPPPRGWHWFEDRGDIVCELAPTTQDVLMQIADDISRDSLADYRTHGYDPLAEQLREVATHRMSVSPSGRGAVPVRQDPAAIQGPPASARGRRRGLTPPRAAAGPRLECQRRCAARR